MDAGDIVLGIAIIVAVSLFARWYFKRDEDDDEVQLQEMDAGLDDRIKELFDETDDDPYGEGELGTHSSYRATLVNRGTTVNKE